MKQLNGARSAQSWPDFVSDYAFTMSGAHRKPAYEIGAPSLSWHSGFWKPNRNHEAYKNIVGSLERRRKWILAIERLILHVYDNLIAHKEHNHAHWSYPTLTDLQPCSSKYDDKLRLLRGFYPKDRSGTAAYTPIGSEFLETRYETVHIDGVWNSMPIDIRFEVNGEYFTITATVDFSRMRPQPEDVYTRRRRRIREAEFDLTNPSYRRTAGAFLDLISQTQERVTEIRRGHNRPPRKDGITADLKVHSSHLYFELWDDIKTDIFYGSDRNDYMSLLGNCFADFRNLALQCDLTGENLINPWKKSNGQIVVNPRSDSSLNRSIKGHAFAEDAIDWVDAIQPILLSVEQDVFNFQDGLPLAADPIEYSFTRVCNDRCIYGSGFGPQIDDPKSGFNPLTYILLFGFDENREMGRHLLREHTIGTLRLAALHDLQRTKQDYDHQLNDIGDLLNLLQKDLSSAFTETYADEATLPKPRPSFRSLDESITATLVGIHRLLDKLDDEKLITFRALRSNLYRQRFKVLSPALKSSDILGYQPFNIFIEHRLDRAYSIIQVVAERYKQLREKEVKLRKEWMAIKSERHQRQIEKVQIAAELLFFLVLFPYYVSHTVHIALEAKDGMGKSLADSLHLVTRGGEVEIFWVVIGCYCISILLIQRERLRPFLSLPKRLAARVRNPGQPSS